jgi:hypothetical protein
MSLISTVLYDYYNQRLVEGNTNDLKRIKWMLSHIKINDDLHNDEIISPSDTQDYEEKYRSPFYNPPTYKINKIYKINNDEYIKDEIFELKKKNIIELSCDTDEERSLKKICRRLEHRVRKYPEKCIPSSDDEVITNSKGEQERLTIFPDYIRRNECECQKNKYNSENVCDYCSCIYCEEEMYYCGGRCC